MGVMTLDEMAHEVLDNVNRQDIETVVKRWLYQAAIDLGTYQKFEENRKKADLSLAADADTATVPTDYSKPIRLEYDDGSSLQVITYKDLIYVRENYAYGVTGFPDYFTRLGSSFYFSQKADQAYTLSLYYLFRLAYADFDADNDKSPYPAEWDHALILWATSRAFLRLREWDLAKEHKNMYYAYVKGRLGDLEKSEEAYNETFVGDADDDPFGF